MKELMGVISFVFYNVLATRALALATVGVVRFVRLVDAATEGQDVPTERMALPDRPPRSTCLALR